MASYQIICRLDNENQRRIFKALAFDTVTAQELSGGFWKVTLEENSEAALDAAIMKNYDSIMALMN